MKTFVSLRQLDRVLNTTIESIEEGKNTLFEFSEKSNRDILSIDTEYTLLQVKMKNLIHDIDELEAVEKVCRQALVDLRKAGRSYTEREVKDAYTKAEIVRLRLAQKKQEEKELFKVRSLLEQRLHDVKDVRKQAEALTSKVDFALKYLQSTVTEQLADIKNKKDIGIRIIEAQEQERKRMAAEIHDGPAQMLANLVIRAEYVKKLMEKDPETAKSEINSLQDGARESLHAVRKIIYDLMPMSLNDLGLVPTVKKIISDVEKAEDLTVEFIEKVEGQILVPAVKLTVFRLIQEGFHNVIKYAQSQRARLTLKILPKGVFIEIQDWGIGFDPSEMSHFPQNPSSGGFGLYGMKQRVDYLQGEFSVKSERGKGTVLTAKIPLKKGELKIYGQEHSRSNR